MRIVGWRFLPGWAVRPALAGWCALVVVAGSTLAQTPGGGKLRLPGAIEKAPAWSKDAPFDVAKFFELPPAAEDAAPLYLDALAEFGTELEPILPPARRARSAAIKERAARARTVYEAWSKDRAKADRAAIDAVLAENDAGFRKLDLAQRRPRCSFATGLSVESLLPHAQVARAVARLLLMRAGRALDRDQPDAAIDDLGRMLRLSRDLRPRGPAICQLVSIAIDGTACNDGVPLVLAHRPLKVEACDRLLKLLAEHEAKAIDPFAEGIKADYLMSRSILRVFTDGVKLTVAADGRGVETKLGRPGGVAELVELFRSLNGVDVDATKVAAMNLTNPEALAKDRRAFDEGVKGMLAPPADFVDRSRRFGELSKARLEGQPASFFKLLCPDYAMISLASARDLAYLRAARCLVAVRRWQLAHNAPPTDLAEACRVAGMLAVPGDPFASGGPMKLATLDGDFVVYSVGDDGRDDQAAKDADLGRKPGTAGDYLFRLPK